MAAARNFGHVETWVFDLDNTLYPHHLNLWQQVDERIRTFVSDFLQVPPEEAFRLQKDYYRRYGTTMRGLIAEHGMEPGDYLDFVHRIDHSPLTPNPALGDALEKLPGRKLIFTNADEPYARRVLEALGIGEHFAEMHDIHAADLRPKPDAHGYELLLERFGIDPEPAAMVEDMAQNLKPAKKLGMTTVWVDNGSERGNHGHHPDYIDLTIADVGEWLEQMLGDDE
jgi:putative hydrolase of the HAD superfamily